MKKNHRIAFIYLDEIHHLYHFVSVAAELAKTNTVHILTHPNVDALLFETLEHLNAKNVIVEKRPTLPFRAFTDKLKKRKLPRKGFWIKKNHNYILKNFDAVVFTDYIHTKLLKYRGEAVWPKFIKFPHGIAGRNYVFNKKLLDFDLHVIFGEFYKEELQKRNLLDKHVLVGYPKLDVIKNFKKKKFFSNSKKTVLYNPHFTEPQTSWHKYGLNILEFFYNQNDFNLIFAPHLHLFQDNKGGISPESLPEKYFKADNIKIDLGSVESVKMTYTRAADIYLGDISSQVYEFILYKPAPCIFINSENIDYKNDVGYRFWKCGQVIETPKDLKKVLTKAYSSFPGYKPIQEKINAENVHTEKASTASERAAKAIEDFLNDEKKD